MKTMKDIKGTFTGSLKFGDEVDGEIFDYLQGCVPPIYGGNVENAKKNCESMSFCLKEMRDIDVELTGIMQNGEPYHHTEQGATYMSIGYTVGNRFFWLGILPNKYKIIY